jgi:hypothetical protein
MKESLSMGHILPATVPKSDSNNGGLDTAAKGKLITIIILINFMLHQPIN